MAFIYELKINGEEVKNIDLGFSVIRDFEEALDSGKISIFLRNIEEPLDIYSLIELKIDEVDDYETLNIKDSKNISMIVISDNVTPLSKEISYHRHDLTIIEYTAKFDNYLMNNLSFSNRMLNKSIAPFNFLFNNIHETGDDTFYVSRMYNVKKLEPIYKDYLEGDIIHIEQKGYGKYMKYGFLEYNAELYVKYNGQTYPVSHQDLNLELEEGEGTIEYIIDIPDGVNEGVNVITKHYINVYPKETNTMYEVVKQIQNTISKFGGIESKFFFDETRLFKLNEEDEEYLKDIEAPQVFLQTATVRQILIFVLSYVNALPRVSRDEEEEIDILELEFYGERLDEFLLENILEHKGFQDNTQIGTKSYSAFKNILPNDLNEPTTYVPFQDGYYTVRAENIQMTDTSFELKLPQGKKLYKPIKFGFWTTVNIAKLNKQETPMVPPIQYDKEVFVDLTDIFINKEEWDLKSRHTNFPSVYYSKTDDIDFGLNKYQTENLYWKQGDTSIKLSDTNGTIFQSNLIKSVIYYALRKTIVLEEVASFDIEADGTNDFDYENVITYFIPNGELWFKDLKFYIEYITSEELNIKQDKEDLSQISFYSEMRQNQEENTISLNRASAKTYGDLQRTGNKNFSFMKVHTSFSDMYEVGQVDKDDYVITKIMSEYYNEYIINTYYVTKHHNRISQATFIDQTYRKFDNYAQQLSERHETYNDYIMLVPREDRFLVGTSQTKMVENLSPLYKKTPFRILFGILGIDNIPNSLQGKTKATATLVRTDGFLEEYTDVGQNMKHYILTPLTSAGFRQGLAFKFGFAHNQVAGDGLSIIGGNYYNSPIRYTNNRGRFKYLDFNILNKVEIDDLVNNDYPLYKSNVNYNNLNNDYSDGIISYFNTGEILQNEVGEDALIVEKDMMTNFNLTYSLNILSFYYERYIFGEKFYKNNHLVYNKNIEDKSYIYFYPKDFKYNIFENLKIKDGYFHSEENIGFIDIDVNLDIYNNHYLAEEYTWAIGDENENLIFVSNGGGNLISIIKNHFRPRVREIGNTNHLYIIHEFEFRNIEIKIDNDIDLISDFIELKTNLELTTDYIKGYTSTFESEFNLEVDSIIDIVGTALDLYSDLELHIELVEGQSEDFSSEFYVEYETNIELIGTTLDLYSDLELHIELVEGQSEDFSSEFYVEYETNIELIGTTIDTISNLSATVNIGETYFKTFDYDMSINYGTEIEIIGTTIDTISKLKGVVDLYTEEYHSIMYDMFVEYSTNISYTSQVLEAISNLEGEVEGNFIADDLEKTETPTATKLRLLQAGASKTIYVSVVNNDDKEVQMTASIYGFTGSGVVSANSNGTVVIGNVPPATIGITTTVSVQAKAHGKEYSNIGNFYLEVEAY